VCSTIVLTVAKSDTPKTFDDIRAEFDVQVGRLSRQLDSAQRALEASQKETQETSEYLQKLKGCRRSIAVALSEAGGNSASVQQAIFFVLEQLGERDLLLRSASKTLMSGCEAELALVARTAVLEVMDDPTASVEKQERSEAALVDMLEGTFETLRQHYYEGASLLSPQAGRELPLGHPSSATSQASGSLRRKRALNDVEEQTEETEEEDDDDGSEVEEGLMTGEEEKEEEAVDSTLDKQAKNCMMALVDMIRIVIGGYHSAKTKHRIWSLVCRHLSSRAWPLRHTACVSIANWAPAPGEFQCCRRDYAALCELFFHEQCSLRNSAVEALHVVPLSGPWAVNLVSRLASLIREIGPNIQAIRALNALFTRDESGGGIPVGHILAYETARRVYAQVQESAKNQELRLAAREGLFRLDGKLFSYEQERKKSIELSREVIRNRQKKEKLDWEVKYKVGDFVRLDNLPGYSRRFNGEVGEVSSFTRGAAGQDVWVKLQKDVSKLAIQCPARCCNLEFPGLQIGDVVTLQMMPNFQKRYNGMTGIVIEILHEEDPCDKAIRKARVKLPDQVRKGPLLLVKECLTLVAKGVNTLDRVILQYLPAELSAFDGFIGTVIKRNKNSRGHVLEVEVELATDREVAQHTVVCPVECVLPMQGLPSRRAQSSRSHGSSVAEENDSRRMSSPCSPRTIPTAPEGLTSVEGAERAVDGEDGIDEQVKAVLEDVLHQLTVNWWFERWGLPPSSATPTSRPASARPLSATQETTEGGMSISQADLHTTPHDLSFPGDRSSLSAPDANALSHHLRRETAREVPTCVSAEEEGLDPNADGSISATCGKARTRPTSARPTSATRPITAPPLSALRPSSARSGSVRAYAADGGGPPRPTTPMTPGGWVVDVDVLEEGDEDELMVHDDAEEEVARPTPPEEGGTAGVEDAMTADEAYREILGLEEECRRLLAAAQFEPDHGGAQRKLYQQLLALRKRASLLEDMLDAHMARSVASKEMGAPCPRPMATPSLAPAPAQDARTILSLDHSRKESEGGEAFQQSTNIQVHSDEAAVRQFRDAIENLCGEMRDLVEALPSPHSRPLSADILSSPGTVAAAIRDEARRQLAPGSGSVGANITLSEIVVHFDQDVFKLPGEREEYQDPKDLLISSTMGGDPKREVDGIAGVTGQELDDGERGQGKEDRGDGALGVPEGDQGPEKGESSFFLR